MRDPSIPSIVGLPPNGTAPLAAWPVLDRRMTLYDPIHNVRVTCTAR